jgi:hypothetical protein
MVVGESEEFPNLLVQDHLLEKIHAILEITAPIHDGLVPCFRLFLDALAVAHPEAVKADVPRKSPGSE